MEGEIPAIAFIMQWQDFCDSYEENNAGSGEKGNWSVKEY